MSVWVGGTIVTLVSFSFPNQIDINASLPNQIHSTHGQVRHIVDVWLGVVLIL